VPVHARNHLVGAITLTFFASALSMEDALASFCEPLKQAGISTSQDLSSEKYNLGEEWEMSAQ
jgi:hypothetical protein